MLADVMGEACDLAIVGIIHVFLKMKG